MTFLLVYIYNTTYFSNIHSKRISIWLISVNANLIQLTIVCMKILRHFISYQMNEGLQYLETTALERWNLLSWWRWHAGRKIVRGVTRSRNTCSGFLLQHRPVERVVVLVVERPEEDPVELAEVHVVRRLFEPQAAAVVEVHGELCGEALAQHLYILYSQKMKANLVTR